MYQVKRIKLIEASGHRLFVSSLQSFLVRPPPHYFYEEIAIFKKKRVQNNKVYFEKIHYKQFIYYYNYFCWR